MSPSKFVETLLTECYDPDAESFDRVKAENILAPLVIDVEAARLISGYVSLIQSDYEGKNGIQSGMRDEYEAALKWLSEHASP